MAEETNNGKSSNGTNYKPDENHYCDINSSENGEVDVILDEKVAIRPMVCEICGRELEIVYSLETSHCVDSQTGDILHTY